MKKQLLFLVMILLPLVAIADPVEINGIYYNLITKAKQAEVTSNPNKYTGSIVIPETVSYQDVVYNVMNIVDEAFYNCTALTSISIPNSVTSIGVWAFTNCTALKKVLVKDIAAWCGIKFSDEYSNPLYYAKHLYSDENTEIKDLVIPNSVTSIGNYAFDNCSSLSSITIPNSVTSIGGGAFAGCSGLTSVTIGNSVTSIGNAAFTNCSGLTSVTIPNSVKSIGAGAFSLCTALTSVHISDIDAWCNISFGIARFIIDEYSSQPLYYAHHLYLNDVEVKNLVIPNSVEAIGSCAFAGLTSLTALTIPNSVTSIGEGTFYGCSGLSSITIPNSVTSIGNSAFAKCSSAKSVIIGSNVNYIYQGAFSSCTELNDVYCYAEKVPQTRDSESGWYSNPFIDSYIEYTTLHVPSASVNTYKAANPWKNFKSIVAIDGETPTTQKCEKPTISYENGQLKMNSATEGVEYVTEITDADVKKHYDAIISLNATYNISVYAMKSGYDNSDVATATLCWIDATPQTEGITDGMAQIAARPVLVKTDNGFITVEGVDDKTNVSVYTTDGKQVGSAISQNNVAIIATSIQPGSIAIVKVGEKAIKVVIK